jgi:hypothetical protein
MTTPIAQITRKVAMPVHSRGSSASARQFSAYFKPNITAKKTAQQPISMMISTDQIHFVAIGRTQIKGT